MLKFVYEALLAQGVCPEQCALGVQVTSVFHLCQGKVSTLSILALFLVTTYLSLVQECPRLECRA